jgi:hypothetical protein
VVGGGEAKRRMPMGREKYLIATFLDCLSKLLFSIHYLQLINASL